MKREFKVGQRVRIRQWDDMAKEFRTDCNGDIELPNQYFSKLMKPLCGKVATIYKIGSNTISLNDFEDCDSLDTDWVYSLEMIEPLVEPNTIVIYRKGQDTVALLKDGKTVVKTAIAKCCPTDTFDFEVGAKLALSRLMGDEETDKQDDSQVFKFEVGDAVVVTDRGTVYPDYREFVGKYAECYQDNFIEEGRPSYYSDFKIVAKGSHCYDFLPKLYVIQDTTTLQVFVISENGLKQA